jgi:hypothetical protein
MQFQMVIQEQGVKHFNCPICEKPDMSNKDDVQGMYELLFVNMVSSRDAHHGCMYIHYRLPMATLLIKLDPRS